MQVTMLSGITTSFQRFMVEHIQKAVTSTTINWRLESLGSLSSATVGPVLGDEPTFRFFGFNFSADGDNYSGDVTSVDLFYPSSPYKAVRIEGADFDLGEFKIAAEDVIGGYNTDVFRGFLNLMMSEDGATITGTSGKDVLEGGFGGDSISGGGGNDVFILHSNSDIAVKDILRGGGGIDQITAYELDSPITMNLLKGLLYYELANESVKLAKLISIEGGFGTAFSDEMIGDDQNNKFYGQDGGDFLMSGGGIDRNYGGLGGDEIESGPGDDLNFGGKGNDFIDSGQGNDRNFGGGGSDEIFAGGGHDSVFGGRGRDDLYGGAGNDLIEGGGGNDTLDGGSGNDTLSGGPGKDTFHFSSEGGDAFQGHDEITDFNANKDIIKISYGNSTHDLLVTHNGTDTVINHGNGTVTILGKVLSEDQITFQSDDIL